jgi:branched-chain amino acid transport system permease protein
VAALLDRVGLSADARRRRDGLPAAAMGRLGLAQALAQRPRLLLLDEPLAGLAALEIEDMLAVIRSLAARGTTMVIIEHTMRAMVRIAERLIVLDHGRILAVGKPGDITNDESVIEAYLGKKWAAIRAVH